MKVLIDTNIVLDLALIRLPFYEEADEIFYLIEQGKIEGFISATTLTDIYYILRKQKGKEWTFQFLKRLTNLCKINPINEIIIIEALNNSYKDIDIWLIEDYLKKQGIAKKDLSNVAWQNLLEIAERIKIKLSHTEEAKESWLDEDTFIAYDIVFDRKQLTEILESQQLLPQLRDCLDDIISMAMTKGIHKKQIEKVILVGGSCLIAPVRELITSYFGREKVLINKPFEAVSHGALTLNSLETIDDHLYHSYALRTWNPLTQEYIYNPLFRSGLQYPCELEHPLVLQCANNGQDAIYLDIGQVVEMGKAELSYDRSGKMTSGIVQSQNTYKSLTYELDWQGNIIKSACITQLNPLGTVGKDRLKIHLEIDDNRMLLVTVTDILTQQVLVYKKSIVHLY